MNQENTAQSILQFWFGDLDDEQSRMEHMKIWWEKDPAVDNYIREHFQQAVINALSGKYEQWLAHPHATLALIILADQFCRHIYRNTANAFAADSLALEWAKKGLSLKYDQQLTLFERAFFYLPFEHAEDLAEQQRSVALFYDLWQQAPADQKPLFEKYYEYAEQHKIIIERFGRFPHRNEILNRVSTQEEELFLTGPNSHF